MADQVEDAELKRVVGGLVAYACHALDRGDAPDAVEADLMSRGLSKDVASAIVARAKEELRRAAADSASSHDSQFHAPQSGSNGGDMALGAVICLTGILITVATYSAASGGGTYVVAWGAIVFGVIRFFKGLAGD